MYIKLVTISFSLLVIDEGIKFSGVSCWQALVLAKMTLRHGHLAIYTGPHLCHILNYMACLGGIEFFTGGAPIAFTRLLFVRYPSKVKVSQQTISSFITLGSTSLTVWMVYVWTSTPKLNPDLADMCLGIGHDLHATLFHYTSDHSLAYDLRMVAFSLVEPP